MNLVNDNYWSKCKGINDLSLFKVTFIFGQSLCVGTLSIKHPNDIFDVGGWGH
jgi:hypothetical protein